MFMKITIKLLQWASLCNAFLVEAQWFYSEQSPKAEEYLRNAVVSSGVHVVGTNSHFLSVGTWRNQGNGTSC